MLDARYALALSPYASCAAAPGFVLVCRVSTRDLVAGHANRTSICHVLPPNSARTSTHTVAVDDHGVQVSVQVTIEMSMVLLLATLLTTCKNDFTMDIKGSPFFRVILKLSKLIFLFIPVRPSGDPFYPFSIFHFTHFPFSHFPFSIFHFSFVTH